MSLLDSLVAGAVSDTAIPGIGRLVAGGVQTIIAAAPQLIVTPYEGTALIPVPGPPGASVTTLPWEAITDKPDFVTEDRLAQLVDHLPVTEQRLGEWTLAEAYQVAEIDRDQNGSLTGASVRWPDGSSGFLVMLYPNADFDCYDGYTVFHFASAITATQPPVVRNADGNVTAVPALVYGTVEVPQ